MKKINLIGWLSRNSHEKQTPQRFGRYAVMLLMLLTLGVGQMWAANFTNGEVIFIYANENSAWESSACVKAWFHDSGNSAVATNWLFDKGKEKMFYCVVPASGTYKECQLQRFASNCNDWWNKNGDIKASDRTSGYNTFYSNGSGESNCGWKGTYSMYLKGSTDSWVSNLATFTFSSGTTFTATYEFTAGATSYEFKMCDSYGNWHGDNIEVDGLVVGATYRFTGTINLASGIGSLSMSKTQLTFAIATSATNGSVSPTSAFVGSSGVAFTATPNTGYHWSSWGTTSGLTATNANPTSLTATAAGTLTANFAENTYSLTFSHNGHGSIAVGGNTVASGNTASVNHVTTKTLVASPSTGYRFTGWTLSGTNTDKVTIGNASNASTTIKATNTGATVTAGFTAKTYDVVLDDDGDYGGNGSATVDYDAKSLTISSLPTRDDYRINGFYAPGTGDQVADASGNLQASKNANLGSGNFAVTDANGKWIYDGGLTLYAHWTYDVTEYAVNFGVGTGYSSFGSISAYNNNTSSSISSGSNVRSGHSVTFTASPNTGYEVAGFYSDAACSSSLQSGSSTTYTTSITGATDVYVKFVEKTWSVAFAAGTGGSVTTPNSTPQTVGQVTGISIAATPNSGYTFNTWTISSGSGSFTSAATTNSNTFKPTSASTVTASFTETKHTITINGGTAASTTAGVATTGSATAAAPAAGKKFTGWTLGDGVALSGGALTDRTINFTATQASSVTANYADRASVKMYFAKPTTLGWSKVYAYAWGPSGHNDTYPGVELSTTEVINCVTYYIYQYYTEADGIGGAATGDATWNKIVFGDNNDARKTGDLNIADGHYYYRATTANTSGKSSAITAAWYIKGTMNSWGETDPITHDCVNNKGTVNINLTKGNTYEFKVYNEVNNQMWSNSTACGTSSGDHTITETMASAETLYNDDANVMKVTANVTGPYTFEVSATNASNPKIKVTFPVSYTVNFGVSPAAAADAPTNSASISSGSLVLSGTNITFTKDPTPNTGYTWSHWEKNSSNVGTNDTYTTTISGNTTVNAVYTEDTHTVTLANGGHGHVEINSSTVTSVSGVGIATTSGTITAVPDPGYYFTGWTGSDINNGVTIASGSTSTASITINATADSKTITANFAPIWRIAGGDAAYDAGDDEMGNWSTTANQITNINVSAGVMTSGYVEVDLPANTEYVFKVFNASTNKYWGKTSTVTKIEYSNRATAVTLTNDDGSDQTFRTAAAGTYRFTWTGSQITIGYPASCKVTFGKGTGGLTITASGSTTGSISSEDYVASGENVTFTETHTTGYTLTGWYTTKDTGGSSVTGMSTSDFVLDEIAADATVWSRYSENMTTVNLSASPAGKGTFTCGGDAVTSVSAGVTTHPAVTAVPATGYRVNTSATVWSKDNNYVTLSSTTANPVTITGTGTTGNSTALTATFTPKTYTITLNQNGATTESSPTSLTATYDAKANGASDVFTLTNPERTGYTFRGWNTEADTSGTIIVTWAKYYEWNTAYVDNDGRWIHDGDVEVFAMWKSNEYAVTFDYDETGYGSAGSGVKSSVTATYGKAMPTMGTAPTPAAGYKFMGYFLGQNGTGVQYYAADGSSLINWNRAETTTLYAYFRKTEISSLEHPAAVAKGHEVTVDVNPVFNQSGAQNYMDICWKLLYDNGNIVESGVAVASYTEGGTKPNQVRFTLTDLSSGYYKIQAVLRSHATSFDACETGTKLDSVTSDLRIAGNSTVTIQYEDASGNTIAASTSVEVARGDSIGIKAPSIIGYTFSEWTLGDVLSSACRDAATCGLSKDSINIKAEYDGVLIAQYARKNTIYFKNTLNWPAVYVNLLNEGFWNSNGSGNKDHANRNLAMTRLGESDIWYYEYGNTSTSDYVSFTNVVQNGEGSGADNFWGPDDSDTKVMVVYPTRPNHDANERTAYGFNVNTPMFVPLAGQTAVEMNVNGDGRAYYNNKGYWAKYEPISKETGYTLKIYNKKNSEATPDAGNAPVEVKSVPFVFDGDMTLPVSVTVDLEAGKWYGFKIYRDKGNTGDALSWYGNSGNMSNKHSGDFSKGETVWEFKTTLTDNCGLKTNSAGNYVFTLAYGKEAYKDSMQYLVGVHYPETAGDYRLVYSDENRTDILSTTIPFDSEADTLSFFVDKTASPKLALQKCEVSYDGKETTTLTWTDTIADLFSSGLPSAITKSGVYYFCINKDPETGEKVFGDTKLYEGNFYIRTDGATPSKWDNFRQNNHLMAYSDYADAHENFTHSYTQWYDLTNRKNLKFTVANDYSVSISDTLIREDLTNISDYIDEKGDLNRTANVRFMYNQKTNAISRAYIDGAYADGGDFLKIYAQTKDGIYLASEGGEAQTQITFTDDGNWLYEKTVYAIPGARYKLQSIYGTTDGGKHQITQYFKGGAGTTAADSATMIGGKGSSRMQIRLLYDFKTNRVVTAYQPSGNIDEDLEIHADIMFMREHQGDIQEITFASGKKITDIENIYCGLRFNKWTLNNKSKAEGHATLSPLLSRYERDIFYVSFPYDVRLSDVIGFGTYGTHWIVEYYNGAERAKNGFWSDSESYWHFVTPAMKDTFELKAGTGYIVALDLDELYYIDGSHHASIWNNTDIADLELLFPGKVSSISDIEVTYNMPAHYCTIDRGTIAGNRTKKDSHWNVLGVPTFKNITGVETEDGGGSGAIVFANTAWIKDTMDLKFIYDGNLADNSLTPKAVKGFEFKAMHAYVVQYCGNVTFTTSATPAPASVAARTYAEAPQEVDFRLELNKDGVLEDQTFVSLSNDENASADFRFGEDLSKEFNSNRANIYTFIGTEWVAGNTLPMTNQTTIVPVGVKIAADGEYTFSIPEGTYGVGITLIDNEAGARVNLGLMDYTVTLAAGQIDDRFVLEISPIQQISTDLEAISDEGLEIRGVRKIMIDGLLYIVKDGVVYDARGNRVK